MTGAEIIPVAKAAKKILDGDSSTKKQLAEIAKDSPAMKAAAESRARRVAIGQALLLKAYLPLGLLIGVSKDYFETDFAHDWAEKTAGIPEEHISVPKLSVAVPALQALGYSIDEPALKDMYLTLLATASDDRVKDQAHPAFAEIIRQLSGEEAELLDVLLRIPVLPIVKIRRQDKNRQYGLLLNNVMDLTDDELGRVEHPSASMWIDNWGRLGLVEVNYLQSVARPDGYDWVEERPELLRLRDGKLPVLQDSKQGGHLAIDHGIFRRTDFGTQFVAAVFP